MASDWGKIGSESRQTDEAPEELSSNPERAGNWLAGLISEAPNEDDAKDRPSRVIPQPDQVLNESDEKPKPRSEPTPKPKRPEPRSDPPASLSPLSVPTSPRQNKATERNDTSDGERMPHFRSRVSGRQLVTFYKSMSVMLSSGVPLFACFEFLARDGESESLCQACRRISQRLVQGYPLHRAVSTEQPYFDQKAIKLIEVGYKSGSLSMILSRLAQDVEEAWQLQSQIKSGLIYPLGIAAVATVGIVLLPPLVLNDLLDQIVKLTAEPPALTKAIMSFSALLSSPWVLATFVVLGVGMGVFLRTSFWYENSLKLEKYLWGLPAIGDLWASLVTVRFLSVFALTYECGLPATQCLVLSASATGSQYAELRGRIMKLALVEGGTLKETFEAGGFLSPMALEAVEAGQQTGKVSELLSRSAEIIKMELQTRIEAVAKLVEPVVLIVLGTFVGVFALGCLLPIIKLVETL